MEVRKYVTVVEQILPMEVVLWILPRKERRQ
jgi:hypothetical protein